VIHLVLIGHPRLGRSTGAPLWMATARSWRCAALSRTPSWGEHGTELTLDVAGGLTAMAAGEPREHLARVAAALLGYGRPRGADGVLAGVATGALTPASPRGQPQGQSGCGGSGCPHTKLL